MNDSWLSFRGVGRKPVENPKGVHLGVRVSPDTIRAIDDEIATIQRERPGLSVSRSDVVRMWIADAIQRRAKKK